MSDQKQPQNNKNRHLQIRLTEEELALIKQRAGDLSMSEFVRHVALNQKLEQPKAKKIVHVADPELVRNIAWIGNNINQIAKHLNLGNEVDDDILIALTQIQISLDLELQRVMDHDR